jgi:hypothetical protein
MVQPKQSEKISDSRASDMNPDSTNVPATVAPSADNKVLVTCGYEDSSRRMEKSSENALSQEPGTIKAHQQVTLFSRSWLGRPGAMSPTTAPPTTTQVSFHTPFGGVKQVKHGCVPDNKKSPSRHCPLAEGHGASIGVSDTSAEPLHKTELQLVSVTPPHGEVVPSPGALLHGRVSSEVSHPAPPEGTLVSDSHMLFHALHSCSLLEAGSGRQQDPVGRDGVYDHPVGRDGVYIHPASQSSCLPPVI